jgi:hypothetical protein
MELVSPFKGEVKMPKNKTLKIEVKTAKIKQLISLLMAV